MLVNKVMHKTNLLTPETNLKDAATLMRNEHSGFTPVGELGKLIGVITDRDITIRAAANNANMETSFVKDFMTSDVVTCYKTDDLKEAIQLMKGKKVHRLIVLDNKKDKNIVGVLSLTDIAKKCDDKTCVWELASCRSEEEWH